MDGDRIEMSQRERDLLKIMAEVLKGNRGQREAARLLKRSVRQIRRIQRRLEAEGDYGVVHKLRGRPSNALKEPALRRQVIGLYRKDYGDFGPTLAAEKLTERDLPVARETLRRWLIQEGLCHRSSTALCRISLGARVALLRSPVLPTARRSVPQRSLCVHRRSIHGGSSASNP